VYDYCVINKLVDSALIAKWKKPGYERLCSTYVINPKNYKFGTVSICRVPKQCRAPGTEIEDPTTGCRGCASGSSHNIFDNKYGQYLAAIQVAREEKMARKAMLLERLRQEQEEEAAQESDVGPQPDATLWASTDHAEQIELTRDMIGQLDPEARMEAATAASKLGIGSAVEAYPSGKRTRHN
jgi:hypothetical protein